MMKKLSFILSLPVIFTLSGLTTTANAESFMLGDSKLGQQTYLKVCAGCHIDQFGGDGSQVFKRQPGIVHSQEGLLLQVNRCNSRTGAHLNEDSINNIVKYLNETYYKFE